ncbi:MAG: T9SS type A sorting domain-containing protein [Saprospiraceae bacterium]|nr:T9SS type A sorting domain-containing protein [Saprospiraceae bacterium]
MQGRPQGSRPTLKRQLRRVRPLRSPLCLRILPNNDFVNKPCNQGDYTITNILGQHLMTGQTTQRIDVSALAKGVYLLKIGTIQVKFVKE